MAVTTNFANRARNNLPGVGGVAITPDTPFEECRAVNCDAAGVGTITWADGSITSWYFELGTNPISITNVAAGGAQGNLIAVY